MPQRRSVGVVGFWAVFGRVVGCWLLVLGGFLRGFWAVFWMVLLWALGGICWSMFFFKCFCAEACKFVRI